MPGIYCMLAKRYISFEMQRGGGGAIANVVVTLLFLHLLGCVQGRNYGPHVPDDPCHTQEDCVAMGWTQPLPECEASACTCPPGTCAIYTVSSGSFDYQYFCGPCGMLGSECNNLTDCVVDWQCRNDFCECDQGVVYQGVCLYYEAVPTSVSSVVLVCVLMLLIAVQQLVSSRKAIRKLCRRSSAQSEDEVSRVVASNPQSNDKTAAFTITNTDFMATNEDPDLAWALELSRRYNETDASTWSSAASSFPPPDPRFVRSRSTAQPGPSGWRQSSDDARSQRRPSSRSSLSSTSSSRHARHSSGTVSSCGSSFPSASHFNTCSSFSSSPRLSSLASSDESSLPTLESLRMECGVSDFQSTRV